MGSQGPGRKRVPNRNGLTAEEDALNIIAKEAEARLAAKRAARAEAREIRMKELERQQKEIYQVQKKYYGLDNLDSKWGDIEQWMENSARYARPSLRHSSVSDEDEQMSVRSRSTLQLDLDSVGAHGGSSQISSLHYHKNSKKKKKLSSKTSNGYDDYSTISSQKSEYSGVLGLCSRTSSRASSRCASPTGSSQASTLSTATFASLGSCRGSGGSTVTADTETSMQEIKEIHELKDQIQDVEAKYLQSLKEVKDSLVEMEEKYRKAMVSNAQLDNEKTNLMYQIDSLKDSLMELEEFLAETRRESEDKSKLLEREKHAYSTLQFQLNELKETLKQSEELLTEIRQLQLKQDGLVREVSDLQETIDWKNKKIGALERQKEYSDAIRNERDVLRDEVVQLKDILKKHGIVLGPDLSTTSERGADVADGSASVEVPQGSSVLGPQEFQMGRDGNVGSCREDQDQQSKDLDYEMQNNHLHPHVPDKLLLVQNDGGLINHDFRNEIENDAVLDTKSMISNSGFRDNSQTKDEVVFQDSKGTVLEQNSVPPTKDTLPTDQQESSVSIKMNELKEQESPRSTNYACEVGLVSQEDMGDAQAKKASEESANMDSNASYSQSASSSSKRKKKKKKNKHKHKQSSEKKGALDKNKNELNADCTDKRESDPECGEPSEEVSVNEKVSTNLNDEENMDPENKDELRSTKSKVDSITEAVSESVSQNQPDLTDSMTKSNMFSDFVALQNSSSNTENTLVVKNEREIFQVVNELEEKCDETREGHIVSTCPEDFQYEENCAVDHSRGEKAHLEDLCGDSELNTFEGISMDRGVGGTPSEHEQYKDLTAVQLPGKEQECHGHVYTVQEPKVMEDEITVEHEESVELHDEDLEVSSDAIWSKAKLHEETEQQEGDKHDIGQEQICNNCKPQELILAHSKEVDQVLQMDKQDTDGHDGEQLTERERCITEEQQTVTEEQSVHQAQCMVENEEERSQDHHEMKDTESNAGADDESTNSLQDSRLPETVDMGQVVVTSVQVEGGENLGEQ
ncbi:leucine-rich repeat flightless-interacting protein 1 isoform X2 [Electrophorus electricus]|uniref:leucine-rich repeat flightless-interacting protein 1 isoform X2 n=1 Tax=Electrophorus electricus TaxID=8005 RepID=UPI0015D0757D|nr:leucine-rich repeat flightless-interacting protein 1 isoform X2 [Electrophorus electricus]